MASSLTEPIILGAGPVGRTVANQLVCQGIKPTVVTRSGTEVPGCLAVGADISRSGWGAGLLTERSVVLQCAQPAYHRWVDEFPVLQRAVLVACELAGSALVAVENLYGYGLVRGPITEETPLEATTRKGQIRAEMWNELSTAHTAGRVQTAAVRASDFFGPGVLDSAFGDRFFAPLVANQKADVMGSATTRHSITYVPDLADALIKVAAEPSSWGQAWHAPTAPAITQQEIVRLAAKAGNLEPAYRTLNKWQMRVAGLFIRAARETVEMMYEFEEDFIIDSTAFEETFGTSSTPLTESLAATVAWFMEPET